MIIQKAKSYIFCAALAALSATCTLAPAYSADPVHGLSIYGTPKYAPNFTHFDYVNPDAPKGGTLRMAAIGTFDNLNPYIIKGIQASSIGLIYQTLLSSSADEAFSEYGQIAKNITLAPDGTSVTFTLHPAAKWHDGTPITADDVVWSFNTLTTQGAPFYAAYYADIAKVEAIDAHNVTFTFKKAGNRELPLIVGQLPILPKHFWQGKNFKDTTLEPPLGSGPYKVAAIDAGRSITLERVKDWWAKDLPVNKGRYNFDTIKTDYYRDTTVAVEAFFAGRYDVRQENVARIWATGYDAPPVQDGRIQKAEIPNGLPTGMQGFVLNTRRPVFADRAVRHALQYAFDFEWSNHAMAHDAYKRTASYFENSPFMATGLPEGDELVILEKFKDQLPPELFTTPYKNPVAGNQSALRANMRRAMQILDDAGWKIGTDGLRTKNGITLQFEIIDNQPEFERWVLPFIRNLKRIGIGATFRVVDSAQYVARINDFDFDMTISSFGQSLSPGNEQREYWGSTRADQKGSRNIIGIKNPVIDALCEQIAHADSYKTLVAATKALDRTLLWGYYVVPQWHNNIWRVAYWQHLAMPKNQAPYALGIADTWWATPAETK